LNLIKILDVRR